MSKLKETTEKAEALTRKIYLAGAGVCAMNLETTKKQLSKSQGFIDKLIVRGEKLETNLKKKLDSSTTSLKKQYDDVITKGKSTFSDLTDTETLKVKVDEYRTKVTGYFSKA